MQKCFFSFLFPARCWHRACRAEGDKRGENSEDCWILCPYFNAPLICEWMQIKISLSFFFLLKVLHVTILQNDSGVEHSRYYCMQYIISRYFSCPLNYPMFYAKGFNTFHLNTNPLLNQRAEPPAVPFGQFWCLNPPGALHGVRGEVVSWPACAAPAKQRQHNTRLNM